MYFLIFFHFSAPVGPELRGVILGGKSLNKMIIKAFQSPLTDDWTWTCIKGQCIDWVFCLHWSDWMLFYFVFYQGTFPWLSQPASEGRTLPDRTTSTRTPTCMLSQVRSSLTVFFLTSSSQNHKCLVEMYKSNSCHTWWMLYVKMYFKIKIRVSSIKHW